MYLTLWQRLELTLVGRPAAALLHIRHCLISVYIW